MNRVWDAVAWVACLPWWWRDRKLCRWPNDTHQPMEGE